MKCLYCPKLVPNVMLKSERALSMQNAAPWPKCTTVYSAQVREHVMVKIFQQPSAKIEINQNINCVIFWHENHCTSQEIFFL